MRTSHRFVIAIISTLLLNALPPSGNADESVPKPIIVVQEDVHLFGTVSQGAIVKHDFILKNGGTQDLTIQRAVASCGCTAAIAPQTVIKPGSTAPLSVTFDTAGFDGDIQKSVRVFSSDTDTPQPVLTLKGRVESPIEISPPRVNLGEIALSGEREPVHVQASLKPGAQGRIKGISTFSRNLEVSMISNDGRKAKATIAAGGTMGGGELRDRALVTVAFSDGREQTFNIPVVGFAKAAISLQPKALSMGVIEGSELITKSARVVGTKGERFSVSSVESDTAGLTASVRPGKEPNIFIVTVNVDPTIIKTDLRSTVRILTTSAHQPTLTLNVYGIIPPKA